METIAVSLFLIACFYAVIAHFFVLFSLIKRGVSLEYMRIGVPGYLTGICREPASRCGRRIQIFARSSDIAFWLVLGLGAYLLFAQVGRDAA